MANSKPSRENYTQKIVLLLLPVVGVIALRGMTFLRHPPQSAKSTTSASEQVMVADPDQQKEVIPQLKKHLTGATEAVNSGNYTEAKNEYNEFYQKWTKIEEGLRERSRENYDEMEKGMDQVKSGLINTATPSKDGTLSGLQQLIRALDDYSSKVLK